MKHTVFHTAFSLLVVAALASTLATSCNKETEVPEETALRQIPITITAHYGDGTRIAYAESGASINATWETGDQLLVVYDGRVSTLTLSSEAGKNSATFSGTISYASTAPTSNSVLSCYVKDKNNAESITISGNTITFPGTAFQNQDGTVAGAAKCNVYSGTTTFGNGSNIDCSLGVNCSILKFTIIDIGAHSGKPATMAYKSGSTTLAQVSWTVGAGVNTVYMAVPVGNYSGLQQLEYNCEQSDAHWSKELSADHANFAAGQTYSKSFAFVPQYLYSVGSAKHVRFSPGNLQYRASTGTWRFAEHQWNYIGNGGAYCNVWEGNEKCNNALIAANYAGWIDLFGWGTWTKADNTYVKPYNTSHVLAGYQWGAPVFLYTFSNDAYNDYSWRTLSIEEWEWLLGLNQQNNPGTNCRTGTTVNNTANARYTMATINYDSQFKPNTAMVHGLIIFPDEFKGPTGNTDDITWGAINAASNYATHCTTSGWAVLEASGCVFLPTTCYRSLSEDNNIIHVGGIGYYWSSTSVNDDEAYHLRFINSTNQNVVTGASEYKYIGYAVRLVYDVN